MGVTKAHTVPYIDTCAFVCSGLGQSSPKTGSIYTDPVEKKSYNSSLFTYVSCNKQMMVKKSKNHMPQAAGSKGFDLACCLSMWSRFVTDPIPRK